MEILAASFLGDFTFQRIVFGAALIGLCSGAMGTFLYLRRESLMTLVIGHAATPGVMLAFLVAALCWPTIDARSLPVIATGALVTGLLGALLVSVIVGHSRLDSTTAMAVVLSLFLGGGLLLLQLIQRSTLPNKGGIEDFMFGNAASLTNLDVRTIFVVTVLVLATLVIVWRPLSTMVFDPIFAQVAGLKVTLLSVLMSGMTVLSIVIGIKAVGLILMVAFVVFPPAAARQFAHSALRMAIYSSVVGVVGAVIGASISFYYSDIPTGPMIVLVLAVIVALSFLFSPRRVRA